MILRRFTQHIKAQNWFAVGLDVIVVIVGIFLGMQVTEWNEQRKSVATSEAYIERISIDLKTSLVVMERAIEYYSDALRHAEQAISAFDGPESDLDQKFLINLYQASQTWNTTINRGAYDDLKQSSSLIQVLDPELRTRLSTYYQRHRVVNNTLQLRTGYKPFIRKKMATTFQKMIRLNCGDRYAEGPYGVNYIYLANDCEIEGAKDLIEAEAAKFYDNEEFKEELTYVVSDLTHKVRALLNMTKVTIKLQAFIEENT